MKFYRDTLVIALLVFVLIVPTISWAAEGQGAAGSSVPPSYNVPNDVFHSPGHMQRWYKSPMGNQNPHLWTAFSLILAAGLISVAVLLIRNRQKTATEAVAADKPAKFLADLKAKEKRLIAKLSGLEDKLSTGEIQQEEYNRLRDEYKKTLVKVKLKLKELEESL
ncbi:MAG: hypothetical protein ACYDG6_10720 [Thermincolia bacterium]